MLRFLTSGESHGPQLTAIIDGFPAGFKVDIKKINSELARRQKGFGRGGRMKIENDKVDIVSGLRGGVTLGSPVTLVIVNKDWTNWRNVMHPTQPVSGKLSAREQELAGEITGPRPGHADLPGAIKFAHRDIRNVLERASARETAARTAVGALARQFLEHFNVQIVSQVTRIGDVVMPGISYPENLEVWRERVEKSLVRCPDSKIGAKMIEAIKAAKKAKDSLGGVVEVITRGLPVGLGSYTQWDLRMDSRLAAAFMSIPSVKGVEIGLGFKAAEKRGSQVHDEIEFLEKVRPASKDFVRKSNNAGGIEGGISNGEDIIVRAAVKPVSTLYRPLNTVDTVTRKTVKARIERADTCVVPAVAVIGEAVAAVVFMDTFLDKFGHDNMAEIEANYQGFLARGL
ncbi:MAG: chorismate synthase [Candidatus Zixiibacteriota bacterium]